MKPRGLGPDPALYDAFLQDVYALHFPAELGLLRIAEALERDPCSHAQRTSILADLHEHGRFARFAGVVARLLDVDRERAQRLLDRLHDSTQFVEALPGIGFCWIEGGPAVSSAVRGFLRVSAGTAFPQHQHLGEETVLVIQGAFEDAERGLVVRAGQLDRMPAGSSHGYRVPPDGPDLLQLSITQGGMDVFGVMSVLPR